MQVLRGRMEIHQGLDDDDYYKPSVEFEGKVYEFRFKELKLLESKDLSQEAFDYLYSENQIRKNVYKGFNSSNGTSLYHKEVDDFIFVFSFGETQQGLSTSTLEAIFRKKHTHETKNDTDTKHNVSSYRKLKLATDPSIIGTSFPQIDDFNTKKPLTRDERKDYFKYYTDSLPADLDLSIFKLPNRAVLTDFLSSSFLAMNGFFITDRLHSLLENKDIPNISFHEAFIDHQSESKRIIYMMINELDNINYKRSIFSLKVSESAFSADRLQFENSNAHDLKIDETLDGDRSVDVFPENIVLKDHPLIFKLYSTNDYYISDILQKEFEDNNISGYETEIQNLINS